MAVITPASAILAPNETQQFTVSDILNPKWGLSAGGGSITPSGVYTAPPQAGTATIRAANAVYESVAAGYTLAANENLTVSTSNESVCVLTARFSQAGDYFEFKAFPSVYCAFKFGDLRQFWLRGYGFKDDGSGSGYVNEPTVANGDPVRFELIDATRCRVKINGTTVHTFTSQFTGTITAFIGGYYAPVNTVIERPSVGGAGVSVYQEATTSASVQISLDGFFVGDPLIHVVPRAGLEAWHAADKHISNSSELTLVDLSKNNRPISATSNLPALTSPPNLNSRPAMYFDGAAGRSPLAFVGNLTARHIFVVAAFDEATFTAEHRGLLSDLSAVGLLVGGTVGATTMFNFSFSSVDSGYTYRKSDVSHYEISQAAPMDSKFGIVELIFPSGVNLNGIQIGRDRTFPTRRFKGWLAESLIYSTVKNDCERRDLFRYLAMKYSLWRETGAGLSVFPFPLNWGSPSQAFKKVLESTSISNAYKARTKTGLLKSVDASFAVRRQAEYDAAEAFWNQFYPGASCVLEDTTVYPARRLTGRITTPLDRDPTRLNNVGYKFGFVTA